MKKNESSQRYRQSMLCKVKGSAAHRCFETNFSSVIEFRPAHLAHLSAWSIAAPAMTYSSWKQLRYSSSHLSHNSANAEHKECTVLNSAWPMPHRMLHLCLFLSHFKQIYCYLSNSCLQISFKVLVTQEFCNRCQYIYIKVEEYLIFIEPC